MSIKWKGNTVAGAGADPYTSNPAMDGAASPGSSNDYARGDHVHPNDTSKADRSELSDIFATGTTNATGSTITNGTFFYLNNALVVAKTDIANGAAFTSGTNYEAPTAGALNSLKCALSVKTSALTGTATGTALNVVYYNDFMVQITFVSAALAWADGDVFGYLPSELRPIAEIKGFGLALRQSGNIPVQIVVNPNTGAVVFESKYFGVTERVNFNVIFMR